MFAPVQPQDARNETPCEGPRATSCHVSPMGLSPAAPIRDRAACGPRGLRKRHRDVAIGLTVAFCAARKRLEPVKMRSL